VTATLDERVDFDVSGGVAALTLRRPEKRNAVSQEMWDAIAEYLSLAEGREDVRVLVLRGSGGSFSAGADLTGIKSTDREAAKRLTTSAVRALGAIARFPAPSIARIEGACIGGGCSLALACDIRFATPPSTFGIPAVRHGLVYDEGSIGRLIELMGPSRAARMLYTAERYDGHEAARLGLVDECAEDLDEVVAPFVAAVLEGDAATVRATRRLLRHTN
jgi:enoyl-CoA hydratase/carnithine racemase